MAFTNLPTGIRTWLLFGLQLYNTVQPDGTSPGSRAAPPPSSNTLRYNQIQAVGTHNSYHVTPDDAIIKLLERSTTKALLGAEAATQIPSSWEATQRPLEQQLRQFGLRQIEIDIYPDPDGGLFHTSAGRKLAGENGFIAEPSLNQSGWKVLHVPDIDMNTTCWTFLECLQSVRAWTRAVPYHEPVAIYLEFKEDDLRQYVGAAGAQLAPVIIQASSNPGPDTFITVRNISQADVLDLHAEILSVFDADDIITPDQLRGNSSSLKEALLTDGGSGWPRVDDMRGKVLFVAINTYTKRYLAQFPGLRGALLFVSDIAATTEDVVFLEPANEQYDASQLTEAAGRVTKYVEAGYMVRVRSDYDTLEARANDPSRARTLLAAGAHFTSTDFPSLPTYFNSSYQVRLPQAFTCNPTTTSTSLGELANTFGTAASFDGSQNASDDTPTCS
mmetsp:Transcript_6161/g.17685  ORF Transcript_6161/g.17685 Transcript_6161/m.17685 type:complete len:445 (+) Transcript_6161:269-1603(+)